MPHINIQPDKNPPNTATRDPDTKRLLSSLSNYLIHHMAICIANIQFLVIQLVAVLCLYMPVKNCFSKPFPDSPP